MGLLCAVPRSGASLPPRRCPALHACLGICRAALPSSALPLDCGGPTCFPLRPLISPCRQPPFTGAGVGASLSREPAAQRGAAAAGLQAPEGSLCTSEFQAVPVGHVARAALGVKKGLSFTFACMPCLRTLLAVLMKIVKI